MIVLLGEIRGLAVRILFVILCNCLIKKWKNMNKEESIANINIIGQELNLLKSKKLDDTEMEFYKNLLRIYKRLRFYFFKYLCQEKTIDEISLNLKEIVTILSNPYYKKPPNNFSKMHELGGYIDTLKSIDVSLRKYIKLR